MKILIITDYLPYPLVSGDRIRVYNLIKVLSKHHEITLLSLVRPTDPDRIGSIHHLSNYCKDIGTGELFRKRKIKHIPGLFHFCALGLPLELYFLYSKEMVNKIQRITKEIQFDIVQYEHSRMAFYDRYVDKCQGAKRIVMFHNIIFEQSRRISQIDDNKLNIFRAWLYSTQMMKWEVKNSLHFARCITVSERDRQLLITKNPKLTLDVVENGVDADEFKPLPFEDTSPSLLFIGSMGYMPVVHASLFFCRQILPLIRKKYPSIDVWLVGREPTKEVLELASNHIHVTGRVESVLGYYRRSSVCIVPLKAGGGTRLKILEAMALGRPVVTTAIGCEGLDVVDNKHLMIADTPELFANKVISLIENEKLRRNIVLEARMLVEEKYNWTRLARKLENIYHDVLVE